MMSEEVILQATALPRGERFHWFNAVRWQGSNEGEAELSLLQSAGTTRRGRSLPLRQMAMQEWNWIHMRMELFLARIAELLMTQELLFLLMDLHVSMQVNGVPIVTVAVAYDCSTTGHTFILIFHQALHVPTMTKHLINPFQLCNYGIKINGTPLMHLTPDQRTPEMHSILEDDPLLHIPLSFDGGTMSGFTSCIPTDEEIQDYDQNFTHSHRDDFTH
jgi:hypothetical protein